MSITSAPTSQVIHTLLTSGCMHIDLDKTEVNGEIKKAVGARLRGGEANCWDGASLFSEKKTPYANGCCWNYVSRR